MDEVRKPIPKNQRDISIEKHTAYDVERGNPNDGVTPLPQFKNTTDPELMNNYRANQISAEGDKKPFRIGIQDIDESIIYYFNNVVQPFVYQNNQRIAVPVIYGSPERWAGVQKDGFYRDKNSKIMAPMIMFRRASISRNPSLSNKIDANSPHNIIVSPKSFHKSNIYSQFDVLNNRQPVTTYQVTVVPDYVDIVYNCVVWTYYIEQMNKIVETVNYMSDSYWGDPNKFKFAARIEGFTNNETLTQGQERLIKTNFDIKLKGYLIPDTILGESTTPPKVFSKSQIVVTAEVVNKLVP